MRVAIIGGGISGLTAAYELELARKRGADIDWHLYEATDRLGGIIETTREDGFILEGGPDGWVTEKPWARDLAIELGLESDNSSPPTTPPARPTFSSTAQLQPIPDGMRMMVPTDLAALDALRPLQRIAPSRPTQPNPPAPTNSRPPLPSTTNRRHLRPPPLRRRGPRTPSPLRSSAESSAATSTKLSVRAVMARLRRHGARTRHLSSPPSNRRPRKRPSRIFTTLRNGMDSLVDALVAQLPAERIRLLHPLQELVPDEDGGVSHYWAGCWISAATNLRRIRPHRPRRPDGRCREFKIDIRQRRAIVSRTESSCGSAHRSQFRSTRRTCLVGRSREHFHHSTGLWFPRSANFFRPRTLDPEPSLLACTFVDQKFPHRVHQAPGSSAHSSVGAARNALLKKLPTKRSSPRCAQLRATSSAPSPTILHRSTPLAPQPSAIRSRPSRTHRPTRRASSLSLPRPHAPRQRLPRRRPPDLIRDARSAARALIP